MTRTIKASEVKPGMKVRFNMDGWRVEGVISLVEPVTFGVELYSDQGVEMTIADDDPVTVLSDPELKEPQALGARVIVGGHKFVRMHWGDGVTEPWVSGPNVIWCSWDSLLGLGPVTVIDADPSWTVPANQEGA